MDSILFKGYAAASSVRKVNVHRVFSLFFLLSLVFTYSAPVTFALTYQELQQVLQAVGKLQFHKEHTLQQTQVQ